MHPSSQSSNPQQSPSSEWDDLAAMTGFVLEPPPGKPAPPSTATAVLERESASDQPEILEETVDPEAFDPEASEEEFLLDPEDLEGEEAYSTAKTKTPIWSDPFAKAGLVSILMAGAVGTVGLFLLSVNSWDDKAATKPPPPSPEPTPTADPSAQEIGRLKTETALRTQTQTIAQTKQNTAPRLPTKPNTQKSPLKTASTRSLSSTPVRTPAPVAVAPPVRSYTPVISPSPIARSAPLTDKPLNSVPENKEPNQAWQDAVTVGSFGQGSDGGEDLSTAEPAMDSSVSPSSLGTPSSTPSAVTAQSKSLNSGDTRHQEFGSPQRYDADVNAIMTGEPSQVSQLMPGSTAAATLNTPIVWAEDIQQKQPQQFTVQLNEPLLGSDGSVALPAGTELVAQVDAVSDSGMVQLSVSSVVIPSAAGSQIVQAPPGSLTITGEGGNPVMADNINRERGRFGKDLMVALTGALGQTGKLLNRPQSESVTSTPSLSSSNITNGKTDIGGALLEGAFGAVQKQMTDRNQQSAESNRNRTKVWRVPAGKQLQVQTNSIFEVAR
ncbi:TrbI/VirB10 family protein (plasmid) [Phormidium sp. CLA17]|uniref:TrbI/VirB10 family protein n=1 Tax=Leptolyngbya sp. Cla-17 TaxID=2803751 RepID=UPI001490A4C9|nr:TrbI/VirB10 family protein [Leptolyngbya sp. Cla-17]MBM0744897.1 TrbI/VirB10 family protein [Leptolyngbya sp. Cla-17]